MRSSFRPMLAVLALPVLAFTCLPLAGCGFFAAHSQVRGNRVDPEDLAELVPGTSTRTDAESLLGTPTAHASFDDNTWLYIGSITRPVIGGTQHENSREIVALVFDQNGVLQTIQTEGKQNGIDVKTIARTTPSPGSSASFMQQLLGNVGRFNAATQQNTAGTAANGSGDNNSDSSRFNTGQ